MKKKKKMKFRINHCAICLGHGPRDALGHLSGEGSCEGCEIYEKAFGPSSIISEKPKTKSRRKGEGNIS